MKKIDAKLIALTTIICMLPMVAGIALYKDLPDVMTTHWTFGEKADGWMPKSAAVFLMPVLMAVFQLVMLSICKMRVKTQALPKLFSFLIWLMPILSILLYALMLVTNLDMNAPIDKIICLILGIMFLIIGNYSTKMSFEDAQKYMHPAPRNEASFRKMSKLLAYGFIGIGIVLLVLVFIV